MNSQRVYDVAVIGGGIVGTSAAWALVERGVRSLVLLEAEAKLAAHQTGNNSGVIHSGLYYRPGSLKARLCVAGREALYRFCQQHGVAHQQCGKLVVAASREELPRLEELARRGEQNGLAGLRLLAAEAIKDYEPHCVGAGALMVPQTGIVDFVQVTECYARLAEQAGAEIRTGVGFLKLAASGSCLVLETTAGPLHARHLVNCAGLHADRVARRCGMEPGVQIVPFRGEYFRLVAEREHLVRNLIYPVPDPRFPFLGVHFTRLVHGGVEAGPNAVLALSRHGYTKTRLSLRDVAEMARYPGLWRMAARYWRTGLAEQWRSLNKRAFVRALQRLVPEVQPKDLVPAGAGVRAQALDRSGRLVDDFWIEPGERMIHVLNAPSPAATASLMIGREIADRALTHFALDCLARPQP